MAARRGQDDERAPLLQNDHAANGHAEGRTGEEEAGEVVVVDFEDGDPDNPKNWSKSKKMVNVFIIALMAILSPLASSMFTPAISQIADDLNASIPAVVGATTGFVICLGIGPMILAPLSETFGRRPLYLIGFSIFTLTQVPTALSPNIAFLNTFRTIAGFFGSVGVANGGGTLSDMFEPSERAGIFGWYLLGPLLGPTFGGLLGGIIVQHLRWRWVFWILTIICAVNTLAGFLFLRESYAPSILAARRRHLEKTQSHSSSSERKTFRIANQDDRPLHLRLRDRLLTPLRILFTQPIVLTMAIYQAVLYGTMYSLWTNFEAIYSGIYHFNSTQVGLAYIGPGIGFVLAVRLIVPRIDTVYKKLALRNAPDKPPSEDSDQEKEIISQYARPEYRLPLANIGAVLIPISLFWFAWAVELRTPWIVSILSTIFFGIGQVTILNTVQNYYIDAFSKYAASALAAGALFRALVGGVLPLFAPGLFEQVGYGWGISVSGFVTLAMAPAPWLFMRYGASLRERFAIEL